MDIVWQYIRLANGLDFGSFLWGLLLGALGPILYNALRRKDVSGDAEKAILETIEKADEEGFQECVKLVVLGAVAEGLEKTKKDMVQALYQGAVDAGKDKKEALKDALEKWEKILTKAKEHLDAKGMDYKR